MFGTKFCLKHGPGTARVICTRVQLLQRTPDKVPGAKQLHNSTVLLYSRSSDVDKARQFLDKYHRKTIKKYGYEHKDSTATGSPSPDGKSLDTPQVRVHPKFLQQAKHFNMRAYFCHTEDSGNRRLIRYKMSSREKNVLAENLDSTCHVGEVAPSSANAAPSSANVAPSSTIAASRSSHLAVLVSSDSFSAIYIIDERTGEVLTTLNSGHQLQWISNDKLFYTTINRNMRPDCVYFVDLNNMKPELCYQSNDKDAVVSITCSKDSRYTTVNINTKIASQVYLLDNTKREITCQERNNVCHLNQGIKCYIEHLNNRVVALMSSEDDPNLSLYWFDTETDSEKTEISDRGRSDAPFNTANFTKHPGDFGIIHEMEVFDSGIVLYNSPTDGRTARGCHVLTLLDPVDFTVTKATIPFPEDVSLVTPNNNTHASQTHLKVLVRSYTKPLKQLTIPFSKFAVSRFRLISRGRYDVMRSTVKSADADVPITVIGKAAVLNTCSPCLFIVYGCYGENLDYAYETLPFDLLDKDWKVVLCHVRGGAELGRSWYLQGLGSKKHNAILDTLNCIKHLHSVSLSTPHTSTLQSFSAGAVIAASVTQAVPGITHKLVLRMPFLDLQTAMLTTSEQPLSTEERAEWSNPAEFRGSVEKLCPCNNNNVMNSDVYVTVALNDRRTPCWHTANFLNLAKNKGQVFVNLLETGDHASFDEEACRLETRFIADQSNTSVWKKLKSVLY